MGALVILGIWLGGRAILEREAPRPPAPGASSPVPDASEQESRQQEPSPAASRVHDAEARSERVRPSFSLRVVDAGGRPVEGARVSWVPLDELVRSGGEDESATERALERAVRATSREDGTCELRWNEEALPNGPAVVLAMHPGHLAGARVFDGLPPGGEIRLGPPSSLVVLARDAAGNPLEGLEVRHEASRLPPVGTQADALQLAIRRVLREVVRTDASGRAALAPFPGDQWLRAQDETGRAAAWFGAAPAEIEWTLAPVFRLSGRVRADGERVMDVGAKVVIEAGDGLETRPLAALDVPVGGGFGPVALPSGFGSELSVRAEARGFVPAFAHLPMPEAGAAISVELSLTRGLEVPVRVVDDARAPLAGAEVRGWWFADDHWAFARERTGEDGRATVRSVPADVPIWLRASAPGHTGAGWPEPRLLTETPAAPFELVLPRSGRIVGRVFDGKRPAETFQVVVWDREGKSKAIAEPDPLDPGRFVVEDAPTGALRAVAKAPGRGASPVEEFELAPGSQADLELHLRPGLRGSGRILDAVAGTPVVDARVQLYLWEEQRAWRTPLGPEHRSDETGTFVLEELVPGTNWFLIFADGYGTGIGSVECAPGEVADLGVHRIAPLDTLEVRIEGADPSEFEEIRVELNPPNGPPPARPVREGPDRVGIVRFEEVRFGTQHLVVTGPGDLRHEREVDLMPGERWVVVVPLACGEDELRVRFEPPPGVAIPEGAVAVLGGAGGAGDRFEVHVPIDPSGEARFRGPFPHPATVAMLVKGIPWGARTVRVEEEVGRTLVVPVNPNKRDIILIGPEGEPLVGALVHISLPGGGPWHLAYETRSDGSFDAGGFGDGEVVLDLDHPRTGPAAGIHVRVPPPGESKTVRISGRASLTVRIHDRDGPLVGVTPYLLPPDKAYVLRDMPGTDAEGRSRIEPIVPGEYAIEVFDSGIWPARVLCTIDGGTEVELEARRLGGLSIETRDAGGSPVPDVEIELESIEFGRSLAEWLEAGRVRTPPSGTRTGPDGTLHLAGLPNGPYRLIVHPPAGAPLERTIEVPPAAHATVALELP